MAAKEKSAKLVKFPVPDRSMPVFAFETDEWRKTVGGALLKYARSVRVDEMRAVELLANMQSFVNALSERLDMVALEDKNELVTMVFPNVRVKAEDPAYRQVRESRSFAPGGSGDKSIGVSVVNLSLPGSGSRRSAYKMAAIFPIQYG